MEYDELKSLWEQYNTKLDKIERLNKKLIRESLLKKPKKKLNWQKLMSIYGLIALPVILIVAMHPYFNRDNISSMFVIGCILTFAGFLYVYLLNLKAYRILKQINIDSDTIIESAIRISTFKRFQNSYWKHAIIYYPLVFVGVLFVAWDSFKFDFKTIAILSVFFIITYALNIVAPKMNKNRIARLESEVEELKEYTY